MRRTDRLQALIALLRDGEMHRARDLAARLGVSERTIWRDMDELRAYDVPVIGSRGVGYMLRRAVALPPLVLLPEELAALEHLLRLTEAHADTRIGSGARTLAAKIRAVLPPPQPESGAVESEAQTSAEPPSPLAPPRGSG